MTSSKGRQQREAARARLARQMAERQAAARRRRQRLIGAGAGGALLLVVAATFWVVTAVTSEPDAGTPAAAGPGCTWNEMLAREHGHQDQAGGQGGQGGERGPGEQRDPGGQGGSLAAHPDEEAIVDVGLPPTDVPQAGTRTMTVATSLGDIVVELDLAAAPCVAASFTHLAGQDFYDGSKCHRMFPGMLQCGDPTARGEGYRDTDGTGGPSYQFADENLPTDAGSPYYPAGTVAMANSGPDTNGSQFFVIYQDMDLDGPNYSVVGQVVEGLDVLAQLDEIGHDGAFESSAGGGHPNEDVVIEDLQVSEVRTPGPTGAPSPAPGGSPAPTPTPAAAATPSAAPSGA